MLFDKDELPGLVARGYTYVLFWTEDSLVWKHSFHMDSLECVSQMKGHEHCGYEYFYVVMEIKKIIYPGERWGGWTMQQIPPDAQQFNLMQYIENRFNSVQWSFNAITEYLEHQNPGAKAELERRVFYHKCWSFMMGREVARKKAPPDQVLAMSAANSKVIEDLRKEAKEEGWIDTFNKAEFDVKHEAREMYGR